MSGLIFESLLSEKDVKEASSPGFFRRKIPNLFSFLNECIQEGGQLSAGGEEKEMAGIRQTGSDPANDRRAAPLCYTSENVLFWVTSAEGVFRFLRRLGLVLALQVLR